jgi:hypothetical protein
MRASALSSREHEPQSAGGVLTVAAKVVNPSSRVVVADLVFGVLTVALYAALTVLVRAVERW